MTAKAGSGDSTRLNLPTRWGGLVVHAVDDSERPIVAIGRKRSARAVDIGELLAIYDDLLKDQRPFLSLHDCRWEPRWSARDRQQVYQWLSSRKDQLSRLAIAHAVVMRGMIGPGMVNAVFWGTSLEKRARAINDLDEAKDWLLERWRASEGGTIAPG